MDRKGISELVAERNLSRKPQANIKQIDDKHLSINGHRYDIIVNEHEAFDVEEFKNRYVSILSHYNYIVGDVGYGQLRLKGFYNDDRRVKPLERFASIDAYISEFCNFGSPYFVLHNLEARNVSFNSKRFNRKNRKNYNRNFRKRRNEPKSKFSGHKSFKIITKSN